MIRRIKQSNIIEVERATDEDEDDDMKWTKLIGESPGRTVLWYNQQDLFTLVSLGKPG
jgi:hypothetical protein